MTREQNRALQDFVNKHLSIQDVIRSYGYEPRQDTDDRLTMLCPFHNERTGSFKIYLGTNRFHCFGCDTSGAVVEFIMYQEKKTRQEVLDTFRGNVDVTSNKFAVETIIKQIKKGSIDPLKYNRGIHFELRVYLRDCLKKHPAKKEVIDSCFREMRMFFFNPDNTDEAIVKKFSDYIIDKVSC